MNHRRKFILALGAVPFAAYAQQPGKVWRVGYLTLTVRPASIDTTAAGAFQRGLRELGYVEGKNLVIEWRFTDNNVDRLAELSMKHRLLCMTADPIYVEAGCLMSYGTSLADDLRRAATYVDKIFKGAKPAELPIGRATTFELVINLKTARALGLNIPQSMFVRADRVIE